MTSRDKYVVCVHGFRLFNEQARWDKDNIIDENIDVMPYILDDDKTVVVMKVLATLSDIIKI